MTTAVDRRALLLRADIRPDVEPMRWTVQGRDATPGEAALLAGVTLADLEAVVIILREMAELARQLREEAPE